MSWRATRHVSRKITANRAVDQKVWFVTKDQIYNWLCMSIQTAMEQSPRSRERYIKDILAAFTEVLRKRNEKSLRV